MSSATPKVRVEERRPTPNAVNGPVYWEVCVPFPSKEYATRFARSINRTRRALAK